MAAWRCSAFTMTAFSSKSAIGRHAKRDPRPGMVGKATPRVPALGEHLGPFGVIGYCADDGTGQHQLGLVVGHDEVGETLQDAGHVLEPVPPRHLHDQRDVGIRRRTGPHDVDAPVDAAAACRRGAGSRRRAGSRRAVRPR